MIPQILVTYKNLMLQALLSISLSLIIVFLKIPTIFFHGLFTYIHPDNVNSGARAAIRRPGSYNPGPGLDGYQNLSSKTGGSELRKRNKGNKEKFEFDENKAQIFRLKLDDNHLQSRLYFNEYRNAFTLTFLGISGLLLQSYLGVSEKSGFFQNGILVPLLFGFLAVVKIFISLAKVSFEKSASRRLDKQLSVFFGILGFVLGLTVCFTISPAILDFDFSKIDGFGRVFVAILMGCLAAFLFMPASKCARSFWLGTDQLRSNLDMISCGWFGRTILYSNHLVTYFTVLLWINPLADFLVRESNSDNNANGNADRLARNIGFSRPEFVRLRIWLLFLSGFFQIAALRPNLQMYLNEALLSWYQRLHGGKIPDLDFSRAKVFLHNHYLCLAVVQFLAPAALVLLFSGLSQIDFNSFYKLWLSCDDISCSGLFREVPLFMAWWVVFVSAVYTSANLVLYRRGILYVS